MPKVTILGCGWIGQALVGSIDTNKYKVHCLSRNSEENSKEDRYSCDSLVIAIPPRDNYLEVLSHTLAQTHPDTQIILLSSISFYDEKPLVIEAETLVQSLYEESVILRLGGLMGYDRIAGKYTAGKTLTSDARTNYVHRDDVVNILNNIITRNIRAEVFDVVAPLQCTKKEIFRQNAKRFGFKETEFFAGDALGKVLTPSKVCDVLDYTFVKEDVRGFWD